MASCPWLGVMNVRCTAKPFPALKCIYAVLTTFTVTRIMLSLPRGQDCFICFTLAVAQLLSCV